MSVSRLHARGQNLRSKLECGDSSNENTGIRHQEKERIQESGKEEKFDAVSIIDYDTTRNCRFAMSVMRGRDYRSLS